MTQQPYASGPLEPGPTPLPRRRRILLIGAAILGATLVAGGIGTAIALSAASPAATPAAAAPTSAVPSPTGDTAGETACQRLEDKFMTLEQVIALRDVDQTTWVQDMSALAKFAERSVDKPVAAAGERLLEELQAGSPVVFVIEAEVALRQACDDANYAF